MLGLEVVAEAIRRRLEIFKAFDVGPVLRRIPAAAGERHRDVEARVASSLLDRRRAGKHDRIGHRQ